MQKIDETIEKIKEMFLSQDFPKQLSFQIIRESYDKPSNHWSLLNRMIMNHIGNTNDARTYNQWKQVGRFVTKGSKAFSIIAPITIKKTEIDKATGKDKEVVKVVGFRGMAVFGIEQTDGDPLPTAEADDHYQVSVNACKLIKAIKKLGGRVEYEPYTGTYLGYYSPSENKIVLSDHSLVTLAHESTHFVVHHVLHLDLKRDLEECIAELGALTFCELVGETGYEKQSYNYIRKYSGLTKGADPHDVVRVISKITNTVGEVIETLLSAIDQEH